MKIKSLAISALLLLTSLSGNAERITLLSDIHVNPGNHREQMLREVIDDINTLVKANHIKRLQRGVCTIEQGFVLSDISTNLERVSDHCSNIAISVIEIDRDGFDAHGYLENLKKENDPMFAGMVENYRHKYLVPTNTAE